jgi:multiple sugar transport system substrate-binding protein
MNTAVNGGPFHQQLTMGEVAYTDPKVKQTFGYIADLSKKGYFIPNATSYSWQEAANLLFDGKAAMYLMGQFIKDVAPADKKDAIDFFQFPYVAGRTDYAVDTPTDGYMVPVNAQHKQAAKKFMAFLATKEIQEMFCKPLGRLAANVNVPVPNEEARRGLAMVKGAAFAAQFYDRDAPEEMAAKGMNAIIDIMANPDQMDQILAALDKERVRIYAELAE